MVIQGSINYRIINHKVIIRRLNDVDTIKVDLTILQFILYLYTNIQIKLHE
jgi:hypothetical protein